MSNFADLDPPLSAESLAAVASFGFTTMTPVQASAIPYFLKNKDVCVEATTGSGKTLAFGLPIFEIINKHITEKAEGTRDDTYALIMAPTRELASQIHEVINSICKFHTRCSTALFVGGTHIAESCKEYEAVGGHIVIGTPGRILDMKNRIPNILTFKKLEVLVLDEADTLLDMGFRDTITQLLAFLPKQRRTGLFSATQTKEVKELARAGMRNPVSISVRVQSRAPNGADGKPATNTGGSLQPQQMQQATPTSLDNCFMVCEYDQRGDELLHFLNEHLTQKIIVFCATCACVDYYSNVFEQIAKKGKLLPSSLDIVGFHGKMVPKKRTGLYRKFVKLASGVMFSTDVAARGVDIPDVDWIVQLAAPKDPAFFVHRVGRTARAGRTGGALLFVTAEEQSYVDLLRGRGVPLRERERATSNNNTLTETHMIETNSGESNCRSALLKEMKLLAMHDRTVLECGSTAFMSFLRAYQEHMCSYIFRFEQLDIGAVARAYALLRLPKIPETRGVKGKPIVFEITNVDTSKIAYVHKEQEEARQRRLLAAYEAAEAEDKKAYDEAQDRKNAKKSAAGAEGSDNSDADEGNNEPGTTQFKPHDVFLKKKSKEEKKDRKRKQKGGLHKKIMEDWDDLAAEEMAYKKFKKGHISKEEYDQCLMSDKKLAVDPDTGAPLLVRQAGSDDDSDAGSDSGDDSDLSDVSSDSGAGKNKKKVAAKGGKKAKMVLKYQDDKDLSDDDSSDDGKPAGKGKGGAKKGPYKPSGGSAQGGRDYRRVKSGHSFPGSVGKAKAKGPTHGGGANTKTYGGGGKGKHGGGKGGRGRH